MGGNSATVEHCRNGVRPISSDPSFGPQSAKPLDDTAEAVDPNIPSESDFDDLVSKLTLSGGNFSGDLAVDLALDIVLNQLAEQAYLATGARGAAILLLRDTELVCRASSGVEVPELGSKADGPAGLAAARCMATRQWQCLEGRQNAAVVLVPIARQHSVDGVLELAFRRGMVVSPDQERLWDSFARRVVKNLERASRRAAEECVPREFGEEGGEAACSAAKESTGQTVAAGIPAARARRLDVVSWSLAAVVFGCAIGLGVLAEVRLSPHPSRKAATTARSLEQSARAGRNAYSIELETTPAKKMKAGPSPSDASHAVAAGSGDELSQGGLVIYRDGKEIFRQVPIHPNAEFATGSADRARSQTALPGRGNEPLAEGGESVLLYTVDPEYPRQALEQHIGGPVVLEVSVDEQGAVAGIETVSGPAILVEAAREAVKQWRFRPTEKDNRPMQMEARITVNFKLPS